MPFATQLDLTAGHFARTSGMECDLLSVGQYLQPSVKHGPVSRFYTPEEFNELRDICYSLGFAHVAAGPLVRSSYLADVQHETALGLLESDAN